jgi:hypothetical protein
MIFPDFLPVYGDQKYRNKKCPVESAEQITFFNTLRREYPELAIIAIHPRNEGKRTVQQAQRQKAEGMTPGASDIVIPCSVPFVCELKRQDHTLCHWEPNQLEYLETAKKHGAFVCVALGYEAALEALKVWIGN